MRVAQLCGPHQFQIIEGAPLPDPGPGQVQARVSAVGICGSDVHYFAEGAIGDVACTYPMVLGHEPVGTILKTGPGVTGWAAGDRAFLEPALYCYHCEFCLTGHHNVCEHIRFMSQPTEPGFFRDIVNLPAANLLALPAELSAAEGTLVEPLGVVLNSMRFVGPVLGQDVLVLGAGPIGLLTVLSLRVSGARRIWVSEPLAPRREMALKMGADVVMTPGDDPVATVASDTGRRGVDVAIDCYAREGTINQGIRAVRNAGRVVVTGIPCEALVPLDFNNMRRKEITLHNVRRGHHQNELALTLLREQRARVAPMLSHELPLEQVQKAFSMLETYADGVGKVVLTIS
jgi:L-iditol 2-dehydrogenase